MIEVYDEGKSIEIYDNKKLDAEGV